MCVCVRACVRACSCVCVCVWERERCFILLYGGFKEKLYVCVCTARTQPTSNILRQPSMALIKKEAWELCELLDTHAHTHTYTHTHTHTCSTEIWAQFFIYFYNDFRLGSVKTWQILVTTSLCYYAKLLMNNISRFITILDKHKLEKREGDERETEWEKEREEEMTF